MIYKGDFAKKFNGYIQVENGRIDEYHNDAQYSVLLHTSSSDNEKLGDTHFGGVVVDSGGTIDIPYDDINMIDFILPHPEEDKSGILIPYYPYTELINIKEARPDLLKASGITVLTGGVLTANVVTSLADTDVYGGNIFINELFIYDDNNYLEYTSEYNRYESNNWGGNNLYRGSEVHINRAQYSNMADSDYNVDNFIELFNVQGNSKLSFDYLFYFSSGGVDNLEGPLIKVTNSTLNFNKCVYFVSNSECGESPIKANGSIVNLTSILTHKFGGIIIAEDSTVTLSITEKPENSYSDWNIFNEGLTNERYEDYMKRSMFDSTTVDSFAYNIFVDELVTWYGYSYYTGSCLFYLTNCTANIAGNMLVQSTDDGGYYNSSVFNLVGSKVISSGIIETRNNFGQICNLTNSELKANQVEYISTNKVCYESIFTLSDNSKLDLHIFNLEGASYQSQIGREYISSSASKNPSLIEINDSEIDINYMSSIAYCDISAPLIEGSNSTVKLEQIIIEDTCVMYLDEYTRSIIDFDQCKLDIGEVHVHDGTIILDVPFKSTNSVNVVSCFSFDRCVGRVQKLLMIGNFDKQTSFYGPTYCVFISSSDLHINSLEHYDTRIFFTYSYYIEHSKVYCIGPQDNEGIHAGAGNGYDGSSLDSIGCALYCINSTLLVGEIRITQNEDVASSKHIINIQNSTVDVRGDIRSYDYGNYEKEGMYLIEESLITCVGNFQLYCNAGTRTSYITVRLDYLVRFKDSTIKANAISINATEFSDGRGTLDIIQTSALYGACSLWDSNIYLKGGFTIRSGNYDIVNSQWNITQYVLVCLGDSKLECDYMTSMCTGTYYGIYLTSSRITSYSYIRLTGITTPAITTGTNQLIYTDSRGYIETGSVDQE